MAQPDVRLAYNLINLKCPFPASALAEKVPLSWKLAVALASATSLSPSAMYFHLFLLVHPTFDW